MTTKVDEARKPSPPAGDDHRDDRRASTPEAAELRAMHRSSSYASSHEKPLPYDGKPPLPDEPVPYVEDDGWEPMWDYTYNAIYFYNRKTGRTQWENPRVPEATAATNSSYDRTNVGSLPALASSTGAPGTSSPQKPKRVAGGYNPAIHGTWDPNADYAKEALREEEEAEQAAVAARSVAAGIPYGSGHDYSATAHFNRFTGKFQQAGQGPELHNDEHKSHRQMNAFFDVDAAANSHDGRSLKAERRAKTLSKKELKKINAERQAKKEEKRRAWLLN